MRLQVLLVVLLVSPGLPLEAACSAEEEKWTLGFGSCHHQLLPAPVLDVVASKSPGVFVWLGDNIYNDISRRGLPCTPGTNCNRDLGFLSWAKLRLLTLCTQVLRKVRPELMKKVITDVLRKHNRGSSEEEVEALRMNYEALASKAEFKRLREAVPTQLATWDDHDYCRNDGDSICWFKNESRALFLDFWRPDRSGASRKSSVEAGAAAVGADEFAGHDEEGGRGGGIYESYTFDAPGAVESAPTRIKVIILDTRFNRSPLPFVDEPGCTSEATTNSSSGDPDSRGGEKGKEKREKKKVAGGVDSVYCAVQDPAATLLGEEQWQWLEGQLQEPATLRIIASSITFAASFTGSEAWSLYPLEQSKMLHLIRKTRASGVIFISGDVHYGQLSLLERPEELIVDEPGSSSPPLSAEPAMYPIYDLTSSGLTQADDWPSVDPNTNRIGDAVDRNHAGLMTLSGHGHDTKVKMEIFLADGTSALSVELNITDISF